METKDPLDTRYEEEGRVGELLQRITDDLKAIARDEVELVRLELAKTAKAAAADGAIVLLGGIVALIGLGLLCVAAVAGLEAVIPQLWLRLLIMAIVYLALGGGIAAVFARRLKRDAKPDLEAPTGHAKRTVDSVRESLH